MRRRHRRSAQLTFVMEFPAGEPSSCSPSNSGGSLWSQIHNRPSPQSHLPPSSGPGFAAALLASAENGLSLSMAAQAPAAVSGQQMPALPPGSGPTNRVLIVCRHWFVSVTRHCTRCMPRQQRVYGLSPQDPRFTGANAPRTSSGTRGGQDPALQTAIAASVLEESRQQQIRYIRSRAVQDVESIGADGRIASDNLDNTSALEAAGHQIQHPLDNSGTGSVYSGQQRHEYRFSGASAPVPPGYEHHQGSSNSDSPPYLPSREHHQSAGGGWSGHTAKYHLNNPQQDRPV